MRPAAGMPVGFRAGGTEMLRFAWIVMLATLAGTALAQSLERTLMVAPRQEVAGEARNALVIGNSAYTQGPLRNPVNDARAMAKALGDTGFHVILVENASQAAMQRAVREFGDRISKGGVGLFYYAGHGMQVKGRNYLIPVNADIAREDEIEFTTVDVNLVLAKMDSAKNGLNIVVLDACRNNPFQRSFRSMQTGLAQMDAPTGTFIAFATAPGSVAADGAGDNGVYTKYLLTEISKPGVQIEHLFKQVRNGVMAETKGQQIPWESSSLRGEFTFRPGAAQPTVADAVAEALKREREAQQQAMDTQRREMEKMLQAALQQQRQQLEALGLRIPDAPKPAPKPAATAPKPAPIVTASVAPAPAVVTPSPSDTRLPQVGDAWSYRLSEPRRATRGYTVTVAASSDVAVLESYAVEGGASGQWAHTNNNYLVSVGVSLFSPYLSAFEDLVPGTRLRDVIISERACTGDYQCSVSGRVVGKEKVTVPAGSFDAIKVEIEHLWSPAMGSGAGLRLGTGGRNLTVWYAPSVKRAVKYSSRLNAGEYPPVESEFDLELVSYRLK